MPKLNGLVEPDVIVNGHPLTFAQAMSLRVGGRSDAAVHERP